MLPIYIHINEGKLAIISNDRELADRFRKEGNMVLEQPTVEQLRSIIKQIGSGTIKDCAVITDDSQSIIDRLCNYLVYIEAAGGLVENDDHEMLFIFRRGKWDLPKGKRDEGESLEACALREVQEETGLREVSIKSHLTDTWHVYHAFGQHVLKRSVWYSMHCPSGQSLQPQTEEDITAAIWLSNDELGKVLSNTYHTIKEVLHQREQH